MSINLSVRLDDEQERQLNELVEYYQRELRLKGTTGSQVVRAAITLLHEEKLGGQG